MEEGEGVSEGKGVEGEGRRDEGVGGGVGYMGKGTMEE